MNNVTLVLVIVCTEEMEIYCSTKYLHMTVIMILLEKNLYLVGKRSSWLLSEKSCSKYRIAWGSLSDPLLILPTWKKQHRLKDSSIYTAIKA